MSNRLPVLAAQIQAAQPVEIALIRNDPDLQMRSNGVDPGVVAEYAAAMGDGAIFPPIVLFFDGEAYWPGDGFHRIAATMKCDRSTILAEVKIGSRRDAVLHAAGANASHGLQRTQADKRRSVLALLGDPDWGKWSSREIGKACAVDHKTVEKIRRELTGEFPTERVYTTKHGTVATMKVPTTDVSSGSTMVERMVAKATTEALVAECRRRGLEVIQP